MLFKFLILAFAILIPYVATGKDTEAGAGATVAPAENPPQIMIAASITDNGKLVLVQYQTIYIGMQGACYNHRSLREVYLDDVKIYTVRGEELSIETARERLGNGDTPILCSSWRRGLPDFYAGLFTPEILHFVFPKKPPEWKTIQDPGAFIR